MSRPEFTLDRESLAISAHVVDRLRERFTGLAPAFDGEVTREWFEARLSEIGGILSQYIPPDTPKADLMADVRDFATVELMASKLEGGVVRAAVIGDRLVPILPPYGLLPALLGGHHFPDYLYHALTDNPARPPTVLRNVVSIPVALAEDLFLEGLSGFLATRLAGVRWLRGEGERGGVLAFQSAGPPRPAAYAGQWWDAHTHQKGLTLCYAGTHAVRSQPNHLGGLTTPLTVFLPLGQLFIGADSGPNGTIEWHPNVITVPSMNPVFTTKAF